MAPNPYAAPTTDADHGALATARADATFALVLATIALFVGAPILAPIAAWKATRATKVRPSWQATLALVLALAAFTTSAIFWFFVVWQLLAP